MRINRCLFNISLAILAKPIFVIAAILMPKETLLAQSFGDKI